MPLPRDMTGLKFGRLTVVERYPAPSSWVCECTCGTQIVAKSNNIQNGNTSSCGCLRRETSSRRNRTHGLSRTPEWRAWAAMNSRCRPGRSQDAARYAERGIAVADEWKTDFPAFLAEIGPRPSPRHSVDRIDNNKGYQPGNVRWATPAEQTRNQERNHLVDHEGTVLTLTDFAALHGVTMSALSVRIHYHHCTPHEALEMIRRTGIRRRARA